MSQSHAPLGAPARLRQPSEQALAVSLRRRNDVDVRDDMNRLAARGWTRRADRERFIGTLIIDARADWLERAQELLRVRGHCMCVERFLVRPRLEEHEIRGPADLLEQIQADMALILAARVAVLLQRSHGGRP